MDKINKEEVIGFNSRCQDCKHILIWDFDFIDYKDVVESLTEIQSKYELTDVYIFKTSHGFNAVCLSKLDFEVAYKIKQDTEFSDFQHTDMGYHLGKWVMRIGDDKILVNKLESSSKKYNKSNAHKICLERFFNILFDKEKNFDTSMKMEIEAYWRKKHVL